MWYCCRARTISVIERDGNKGFALGSGVASGNELAWGSDRDSITCGITLKRTVGLL